MSMHKTLKIKSSLERHRNVLTRAERIARLQELDLWTDESRPLALPKIAHRKVSVGKKDKVEDGTEGESKDEDADSKTGAAS